MFKWRQYWFTSAECHKYGSTKCQCNAHTRLRGKWTIQCQERIQEGDEDWQAVVTVVRGRRLRLCRCFQYSCDGCDDWASTGNTVPWEIRGTQYQRCHWAVGIPRMNRGHNRGPLQTVRRRTCPGLPSKWWLLALEEWSNLSKTPRARELLSIMRSDKINHQNITIFENNSCSQRLGYNYTQLQLTTTTTTTIIIIIIIIIITINLIIKI